MTRHAGRRSGWLHDDAVEGPATDDAIRIIDEADEPDAFGKADAHEADAPVTVLDELEPKVSRDGTRYTIHGVEFEITFQPRCRVCTIDERLGHLDSFAIRTRIDTLLMQGKKAYLQAGAGIVADSDPASEFQESMNKAQAVLRAVEKARNSGQ